MKPFTWLLSMIVVLAIAFAQPSHSQRADAQAQGGVPQQPREYLDLPINIESPIQPIPVKGTDGKWYLVYHLFLTNWSFSDLTLKSVEVSDGEHGKTLARYEAKELSDFYRFRSLIPTPPRSEMPNKMYPRQIASGRTGVLFFWLTVDAPSAIPLTLEHRLTSRPIRSLNCSAIHHRINAATWCWISSRLWSATTSPL